MPNVTCWSCSGELPERARRCPACDADLTKYHDPKAGIEAKPPGRIKVVAIVGISLSLCGIFLALLDLAPPKRADTRPLANSGTPRAPEIKSVSTTELPQSPEENFAERVVTYWIPQTRNLPETEPASDAEYIQRMEQLDELVRDLDDGTALNLNAKQKAVRANFRKALIAKQRVIFPMLRKHYRSVFGPNLFRADIDLTVTGPGNSTVRLTSGMFTNRGSIADAFDTLSPALRRLRFKRMEFRWSSYFNDGYTYKFDTPSDSEIGLWNAGTQSFTPVE